MFKDYLHLHFIVLILGFTAILGRLVSVDVYTLVLLRTGLASMGMALIIYLRKKSFKISRRDLVRLILVGLIIAVHWLCFFGSARLATVSVSLIVFSTTSFFTSIIEPIYHKRNLSYLEILLGVMVVLGISCIFTFEPHYLVGILVGLVGAFLAAIFTIMNTKFTQSIEGAVINFYELASAFVFVALVMVAASVTNVVDLNLVAPQLTDWLWIMVLAFGCTLYPYLKILDLLKRFSAFTVNLSVNMEPIYGILLALMIFGDDEKMSLGFYTGACIIFSTLAIHYWYIRSKNYDKRV